MQCQTLNDRTPQVFRIILSSNFPQHPLWLTFYNIQIFQLSRTSTLPNFPQHPTSRTFHNIRLFLKFLQHPGSSTTFSMSATAVLSQLKSLIEKTKNLKDRFSRTYPTNDQWDILRDLSLEFCAAATLVQDEIHVQKKFRSERAWKECEEHRSKAQLCRNDLFATGRLKQLPIFRRNIITIFVGPKDSRFDSEDTKLRKESTRKRCESIRNLSLDGIISWAMAFAPTVWAAGSMPTDVFTCLLDNIEPEVVQTWPQVIRDTLRILTDDEVSLKESPGYDGFIKGWSFIIERPVKETDHSQRLMIHYGSQ